VALADELGLPLPERVVFGNPPLILTVCQLKFASILSVTIPAYVAPFQQAIREEYPILSRTLQVRAELGAGSESGAAGGSLSQSQAWTFVDRSGLWTVTLAEDALAIEARRYLHFENFLGRLRRLLDALVQHIQPSAGLRLGLRYINEIRPDSMVPLDAVKNEIRGPLAVPSLAKRARLSIQELQLQFSENRAVHVRHGLLQGSTVEPARGESVPQGEFYLLDIDAFQTFEIPDTLLMQPEGICSSVVEFHDAIEALFRWSLTDTYTKSMGGRDDA